MYAIILYAIYFVNLFFFKFFPNENVPSAPDGALCFPRKTCHKKRPGWGAWYTSENLL